MPANNIGLEIAGLSTKLNIPAFNASLSPSCKTLAVKPGKIQRFSDKTGEVFKKLIDNKKPGGVVCLIWKDGQLIYLESQGYRNMEI